MLAFLVFLQKCILSTKDVSLVAAIVKENVGTISED